MKKQLMRLLLLAVVFTLAVAAFGTAASASGAVAVASSDFETRQGEEFTTTIYIPDDANIVDFDITVNYDTELITLVSIGENEDAKGTVIFNAETPGQILINYTRTSKNVTSYLPLLDLTFRVNENIGIGTYDCLTIDPNAAYVAHWLNDEGGLEEVSFQCSFAKLTIYEMGDVDLSGKVDIGDATYIRRHLAGFSGSVLSDFRLSLADTYFDTIVDIADAVSLQRHLARLDVLYGNRVNVTFLDINGEVYAKKSVLYNGTLMSIPAVPNAEGYGQGAWSMSAEELVAPVYSDLTEDITLYAFYSEKIDPAMEYYKRMLTEQVYSGDLPTGLAGDLELWKTLNYQNGQYANFIWSSDSTYILNSTTGAFNKPTYPQNLTLTARIISYDANDTIVAEDSISFTYKVPGKYILPLKSEVADWIEHYFTDESDGKYRVNYDVKLVSKLNNVIIPVEGSLYDNFEIRLHWYQIVDGVEVPLGQIKRTTTEQVNDYVAVATFNGKPLEGDGKIYVDDVEVTAIQQIEIKNHIIQKIAANMGTLATDGIQLWNNDTVYGTTVTWETGNSDIAYVANNTVELKDDAVSGATLPLNARVSYEVDGGVEEFVLAYNLTVSCDNTIIKAPENMDPELYKAIKTELEETLGYRGDLTSAALANVKFVNLDLSGYPDIASLRGLSYCTNLRTLNISGLHITDGTMNQIATLSYLQAFIARDCGLDNLADGGTPTLRNAVGLEMLDLTNNSFTSLDSVFAEGMKYGALREVYLSNNQLTDINALQRAPMVTYLSLENNGLTTDGTAAIADYPYLRYLNLAKNHIDSVEHLTGLKYLRELRLHHNELTDVRALRSMVDLEILYLGHNAIQDVGFLNTLTALQILYVNDNDIRDISQLSGLTKLEAVNVSNNRISSLSVLRNYTDTLTEIYAENNNLTDFSFINGAKKLHILMLSGNDTEMVQDNMNTWLSGLSELEVLTLSGVRLSGLSFLDSMEKLVRLDVAGCGLSAFTGDDSNLQAIADRYAKLRVLDISNNDLRGYESELLKLKNLSLLTVLYADNVCENLDAYTLTYSMPELKYISLENCGVSSTSWLAKYNELTYVDLAGGHMTNVDLMVDISNASAKTIEELYLETDKECSFGDAYRLADLNLKRLSLEGVGVGKIEYLPYLDAIEYLNLAGTGIQTLIGDDPELAGIFSISRYDTLSVIDVSHLETDISPLEELPGLETVYAVGAADSKLFYEDNLHALQRMYDSGITCYLYDKETVYEPVAEAEGTEILNLLPDISCDITVAADGMISDSNPVLADEINDFDITWYISNDFNYEIVDGRLAVLDYTGIDDETLTLTAEITVYPDQAPVTREFEINTTILRVSPAYYELNAAGYSDHLTRDASFTYAFALKEAQTDGFSVPVRPVVDYVDYSYAASDDIPFDRILRVEEGNVYTIESAAPLDAVATITIQVGHITADGTHVDDIEPIEASVTVASRTFTATFVTNGGKVTDANGASLESRACVEDSLIFEGLTVAKTGYLFEGWYLDAGFTQPFSDDGSDAVMPSHDITLYAKWKAHSFTLYFNANGGTVSESSRLVLCDQPFGTLPTPTRTGFDFKGWFTADGKQITASTTMATATDITVTAKWVVKTFTASWNTGTGYTITVKRTSSPNGNGSIANLNSGDEIYYGDVLSVTYTADTGYSITSKGSTSITVTGNVTSSQIYAAAKVNEYSVSWSTGTGYTIAVKRTSSPKQGAATGSLSINDKIYYGDVLSVTYTASTGYTITEKGATSITVTGNVTSSQIYAKVSLNSYTYNVVYKSSNGTDLGSTTVTYKYGTTNTISAPSKSGYNTPSSQSVKWDSTTAKTITFTYTPAGVSNSAKNGNFSSSSPKITYSATMNYRNRTATSVQVQITTTVTMQSGWTGYTYGVAFDAACGSASTGQVQVAELNGLSDSGSSRTNSSGWITVPVNTTNATSLSFTAHIFNTNWKNQYVNVSGYGYETYTWTMNIPAY